MNENAKKMLLQMIPDALYVLTSQEEEKPRLPPSPGFPRLPSSRPWS